MYYTRLQGTEEEEWGPLRRDWGLDGLRVSASCENNFLYLHI